MSHHSIRGVKRGRQRITAAVLAVLAVAGARVSGQTFTVTSTADSGLGSLRNAITQANAYAGAATINFNSGLGIIQLASPLPTVANSNGVTINGNGSTVSGAPGSDANGGTGAKAGAVALPILTGNFTALSGTTISGGRGGNDSIAAGAQGISENLSGAVGVTFQSGGTLANAGRIAGGSGGTNNAGYGGDGAVAVVLSGANAILNNTGTVAGGSGGGGEVGATGGTGAQFTAFGFVINTGTVSGADGGSGDVAGGGGGVGINFSAGGSLSNTGTIVAGNGMASAYSFQPAGNGASAVSFSGNGSVINAGTIIAGRGGSGPTPESTGSDGAAITITGGIGTITNQNHGMISGNVTLANYANNVTLQVGSKITGGLIVGTSSSSILTLTDDGSGGTATCSASVGSMQFSGQLIKSGAGAWVMDQTLGYVGGTVLKAGTLSVSQDANLGNGSGSLSVNGGVLQITGNAFTSTSRSINWTNAGGGIDVASASNTFTLSQSLSNGGMLIKFGSGTLVLGGSGDDVNLGGIVNAGTLVLNKNSSNTIHAIGGPGITINSNGAVQLAGGTGDQIYDGGGVTINGGSLDLNGNGETISTLNGSGNVGNSTGSSAGVLTVSGGGSFGGVFGTSGNPISLIVTGQAMTLAGSSDNSYLKATVSGGTLILAKNSGSSPDVHAIGNGLTLSSGQVQLSGTGGDQIYDNASVTISGGTFDMNGRSETIGALIGNAGAITNSAVGSLSTLTVTGGGTFGGVIAGGASQLILVKIGNNSLTLTGNSNTSTGNTAINAGTLAISGNLGSNAITLDGSGNFAALKLLSVTALSGNAALLVNSAGAPVIVLDYNGNQSVSTLQINGIFAAPGIYSAATEPSADPGLFTSDFGYLGTLTVAVPEPSAAGAILTTIGLLSRRRRRLSM